MKSFRGYGLNYSSVESRGRRWFNRGIVCGVGGWKFGILGGLNTLRGVRSMREILCLMDMIICG